MAEVITSFDAYERRVDTVFRLFPGTGHEIGLTLVRARKSVDSDHQLVFSLLFQGGGEPQRQGAYHLAHDELGDIELFLVPVGRARGELQYEAVFNLVKSVV